MKKDFDKACKSILSRPVFLSYLLKSCCNEFKDFSLEEIMESNFSNSNTKFRTLNNENILNERLFFVYDIIFTAIVPHSNNQIRLLINVEAQSYSTSYPLIRRALSYGMGLLVSEKNIEYDKDHYENMQKVYSIWLCYDSKITDTIKRFRIHEDVEDEKHRDDKTNYDIMEVVIIYLNKNLQAHHQLIRLFSTLFSTTLDDEAKFQIVENEFQIHMDNETKTEVANMVNFSDFFEAEARKEGFAKGHAEGCAKGLAEGLAEGKAKGLAQGILEGTSKANIEHAKALLKLNKLSIDEISLVTGLSTEEIEKLNDNK